MARDLIARVGLILSRGFRQVMPDPFVLAVLLTAFTCVLVLILTPTSPGRMVQLWAGDQGVWGLLKFGMQMCLILVTGHAIAASPPAGRVIARVAAVPRTGAGAAGLVALVACATGIFNWGLGLIAGAICARRVGEAMAAKGVRVHYPLLAAAGYLGLVIWHGGLSGSAPLKVTTQRDLVEILGANPPIGPIGLERTMLSPMNLFVTLGLLVLLPLVVRLLHPSEAASEALVSAGARPATVPTGAEGDAVLEAKPFLPRLLEDTPLVTALIVVLIGAWAVGYYFPREGRSGILSLTPDTVNLTMLLVGLVLHRTPASYLRAVEDGVKGCAGIILQFPLYAGVMGLMAGSGLTALLATRLASGPASALPLLTFLAASVINLFVPSGGGQWAVQGPVAVEAAVSAGIDPAKIVMAVAYGDQLTNMLQPFWALPLLAITGVKARDIVGYTAIVMLVAGVWMAAGLVLF